MRFFILAVTVQVMLILAILACGVPPLLSKASTLGVLYGVSVGVLCLIYLLFVFPWVVAFLWKKVSKGKKKDEPSLGPLGYYDDFKGDSK